MEEADQTAKTDETATTEDETNSIEKPKKSKRPRTPAQQAAWEKCLATRKQNYDSREKAKLAKYVENKLEEKANKNKVDEVIQKRTKPKKKVVVVQEDSSSDSESSESSIEVVVKRKPKAKKPKKKEEEEDHEYDTPTNRKLTPQHLISWL